VSVEGERLRAREQKNGDWNSCYPSQAVPQYE